MCTLDPVQDCDVHSEEDIDSAPVVGSAVCRVSSESSSLTVLLRCVFGASSDPSQRLEDPWFMSFTPPVADSHEGR